jgi:hypothetical protein
MTNALHVIFRAGSWEVVAEDQKLFGPFVRKSEAIAAAKRKAPGRVVVHGKSGQIFREFPHHRRFSDTRIQYAVKRAIKTREHRGNGAVLAES